MARVEEVSIKQKHIILSGIDLVSGTPILDIKPYVPYHDSAEKPIRIAKWIDNTITNRRKVIFPEPLRNKLKEELAPKLTQLYRNNYKLIVCAIEEILSVDIRSKKELRKALKDGFIKQNIDNLIVTYSVDKEDTTYLIHDIVLREKKKKIKN